MNPAEIKSFLLRSLLRGGAQPLSTLGAAVRLAFPSTPLPDGDTQAQIRELETAGFVTGTRDDFLGEVWALTEPKGRLRAQQL